MIQAVIETRAIRRLEAMDIQVWRLRGPKQAQAVPVREAEPVSGKTVRARPGRIRLEAGSGHWLLVVDDAERARYASLLEDIRATLGIGECRFGTWSDSPEAGVAPEDWDAHGIRHALVFGDADSGDATGDGSEFVLGGELERLANSGEARRGLWRQLKPLLET